MNGGGKELLKVIFVLFTVLRELNNDGKDREELFKV